ncbi:MAG: hypothetical protein V3U33_00370, partial [candidate division NC10 bacterium]
MVHRTGTYFIRAGDRVRLISRSSNAVVGVEAKITVLIENGDTVLLDTSPVTLTADRVREDFDTAGVMPEDGWVVGANVIAQSNLGKRGQTYMELQILNE